VHRAVINLENKLLLDALMTDVDVHSLLTDDIECSLLDDAVDAVVCSHSIYPRPQLTDSLGAGRPTRLPACVYINYYYYNSAWTSTTADDS